ncbi:hypothetical protein HHI36_019908 [Cryptolaemus montrouzieri]|uniref:Uncharacterized protein n=1 Tax=Cryptolaemus montrouzieri TaxID=559131 RepID=A0ABD2N949_9CUCU
MAELKLKRETEAKKPTCKRRQADTRSLYMNDDSDEDGLHQEGEEGDCARFKTWGGVVERKPSRCEKPNNISKVVRKKYVPNTNNLKVIDNTVRENDTSKF